MGVSESPFALLTALFICASVFFVGGGKWTHRSRLSVFLNKNVNLRLLTWFPLRRDVTISHFV